MVHCPTWSLKLLFVLHRGNVQRRTYLSLPEKESLCMWVTENEEKLRILRSNLAALTTADLGEVPVKNTDGLDILGHDG